MKVLIIALLLIVSCTLTTFAQATGKAQSNRSGQARPKPDLQLTMSIVEQQYRCPSDVSLTLRLTFKNIGDVPVILDKRSLTSRKMVSRDQEAAADGKYEMEERYLLFEEGAYFTPDPSDMSSFIILQPNETYALERFEGTGSFSIYDGTASTPKGYLSLGTHFLQMGVITWTHFADSAPFLQRWKDKGYLWTEGLTSLPMQFEIEKSRMVENCP